MSEALLTADAERIHNRDSFLDNIAQKLGRERNNQPVERPPLRHSCHKQVMSEYTKDELKEVLLEYTRTNLASQAIVVTKESISTVIKEVCQQYCVSDASSERNEEANKAEVLLSADPRLLALIPEHAIESQHYDVNTWQASIGYQRNIELAERAKVGIVYAEQALAESGTMVLHSNPQQGRAVSLLPEASVFVVAKSALFARLTQATAILHQKADAGERMPSCVNFISGPSSTADIELIKVVGVHGPVYATYIIIDDM